MIIKNSIKLLIPTILTCFYHNSTASEDSASLNNISTKLVSAKENTNSKDKYSEICEKLKNLFENIPQEIYQPLDGAFTTTLSDEESTGEESESETEDLSDEESDDEESESETEDLSGEESDDEKSESESEDISNEESNGEESKSETKDLSDKELKKIKKEVLDFYTKQLKGEPESKSLMEIVKVALDATEFQICKNLFDVLQSKTYLLSKKEVKHFLEEKKETCKSLGLKKINVQDTNFYIGISIYYLDYGNCFLELIHEVGHTLEIVYRGNSKNFDTSKEDLSLYFEYKALLELLEKNPKKANEQSSTSIKYFPLFRLMQIAHDIFPKDKKKQRKEFINSIETNETNKKFLVNIFKKLHHFSAAIKNNYKNETIKVEGMDDTIELNPYSSGIVNAVIQSQNNNFQLSSFSRCHDPITIDNLYKAVETLIEICKVKNEASDN